MSAHSGGGSDVSGQQFTNSLIPRSPGRTKGAPCILKFVGHPPGPWTGRATQLNLSWVTRLKQIPPPLGAWCGMNTLSNGHAKAALETMAPAAKIVRAFSFGDFCVIN